MSVCHLKPMISPSGAKTTQRGPYCETTPQSIIRLHKRIVIFKLNHIELQIQKAWNPRI